MPSHDISINLLHSFFKKGECYCSSKTPAKCSSYWRLLTVENDDRTEEEVDGRRVMDDNMKLETINMHTQYIGIKLPGLKTLST